LKVRVGAGAAEAVVDLACPVSLAIAVDFTGGGPRLFGAPPPAARALAVDGFTGSVSAGASCNCSTYAFTPHCDGTHTECAAHLTEEALDAYRVVPPGLLRAQLVSVTPESAATAAAASEGSDPVPRAGDRLVTRRALAAGLAEVDAHALDAAARALVIRTLPNPAAKRARDYGAELAPYLSREAAGWLVERGIEHLIVDLPSIDRIQDEGRLTCHRIFFGLPPAARSLGLATRAHCTVTELAFVPDEALDGDYLLELQVPALGGDAVPSRPLLYRLAPP